MSDAFRSLPSIDRLVAALEGAGPAPAVTGAARRAVDLAREQIRGGGEPPSFERVVDDARALLQERTRALLRPVLNATGVLIHTNLGRVPLGREQLDEVARVAGDYSNLEYDLVGGRRGDRYSHATEALTTLTGAEAALVVNNNAAAVLLVLAGLCAGREVIISRGELVEIGGEFRIPDVMAAAGVRVIEIGTTNRTHLADYERAITPETGAILKVHPSNYQIVGFTAGVAAREVARVAKGRGVRFIHDIGSGLLRTPNDGLEDSDPPVDVALADGADVVTFSGDKLLGGPQCGVIAGRETLIAHLRHHPLLRVVRPDKMTLAALSATLRIYMEGRERELPFFAMAGADLADLERRAQTVARALSDRCGDAGVKSEAVGSSAAIGGGSLPGAELDSWAVAVVHPDKSTAELERSLRHADTPVLGRIEGDRLLLDLRTVSPEADARLIELVVAALS
ncbi:MAG: L-seryl-tRNA(Sec) selenium transferase [Actinomycetota bacterium]